VSLRCDVVPAVVWLRQRGTRKERQAHAPKERQTSDTGFTEEREREKERERERESVGEGERKRESERESESKQAAE
jgi:hypothetical protein